MEEGDVVKVAVRTWSTTTRGFVDVISAKVTHLTDNEGRKLYDSNYPWVPVFILSSLSAHYIIGGDSGGGIWLSGKVVGNTWYGSHNKEIHPYTGEEIKIPLPGFKGATVPESFR